MDASHSGCAVIDQALSPKPLVDAGVTGDVNILSGIDNLCGYPVALGDHASGISAMLTCVPAKRQRSPISGAGSLRGSDCRPYTRRLDRASLARARHVQVG